MSSESLSFYFNLIKDCAPLSYEEERKLISQAQKGNRRSRRKVVEANLKLVVYVAKKNRCSKIPFEDLIAEGNLGLIRAVDKYKINSSCQFSTYAVYWITQKIWRYIRNQKEPIRIPSYLQDVIQRAKKGKKYDKRHDKYVAISEKTFISMDLGVGSDGDTTLSELIGEESDSFDKIDSRIDSEILLKPLDDRERRILVMRSEGLFLREIARTEGISQERVRQLECRAIKKVRQDLKIKELLAKARSGKIVKNII